MGFRKGIVLETGADWAIILMPDGQYKKVKTHQYLEVGEQYQEKLASPMKYAVAAVVLLALVLTGIDYYSVQAYAQVSNLAQLGVNRWGRVIAVQSKDNNGQHILEKVNVKNDKLEMAVEKICSQALKDKNNNAAINNSQFAVTFAKKAQPALQDKMLNKMNQGLKKAVHSQNPKSSNDKTIHNKSRDKEEFRSEKTQKKKSSKSQPQEMKPDTNQEMLKGQPADLNNKAVQSKDRFENPVNKTVPVIQQDNQSNPELKRQIEKEKDHFEKQSNHKEKEKGNNKEKNKEQE